MSENNRTVGWGERNDSDQRVSPNTQSWLNQELQKILFATYCLRLAMKSFCCGGHSKSYIT